MKGQRCSLVDLLKIRQALKAVDGDLERLAESRCVDPRTVQQWRRAADVIDALEIAGDPETKISSLETAQASHLYEIGRHFVRQANVWSDDTRKQIVQWIERVEADKLTVQQLRESLREPTCCQAPVGCSVSDLAAFLDKGIRFRTVYADPPWQYGNQSTRAATDNHYKTMSLDELASLPIDALTERDAQLHLWTTNGFLREALSLIEGWGFAYKSMLVWCKPQMGIGNYWRVSHELLLLGTKGSATFRDKGLQSWLVEERGRHSAKPEKIRRLVERAGYGPRLELFGRHLADGWVVWGNEIEKDVFDRAAEQATADPVPVEESLFTTEEAS